MILFMKSSTVNKVIGGDAVRFAGETGKLVRNWVACVCIGLFLLSLWTAKAQTAMPRLEVTRPELNNRTIRLNSAFQSNVVFSLEASTNLAAWQSIGIFHEGLFDYPDLGYDGFSRRFYRLKAFRRQSSDDWKNQLNFPVGAFAAISTTSDNVAWVKFAILPGDPVRVYYEDSQKYLMHYDFVSQRLAGFQGMDRALFEQVSLYHTNRQIVLGTLLFPRSAGYTPLWMGKYIECGVQFDGVDPYTPDEVARWFNLVKATVHATNELYFSYMPTFEQSKTALSQAEAFAKLGITLDSVDRWVSANACYAPGWAVGRLKYFESSEIRDAYDDGRLTTEDILITDGVPYNTPIVAGILTLAPSTPNSHTAILAQSLGAPFGFLQATYDQERIRALAGRKIMLRISSNVGPNQIKVVDVEGQFTPAFEAELLAFRQGEPLEFAPKQTYGAIWASTDRLGPSDIRFFGGKAANYGLLRQCVPANCPSAIAFSFDLWDAFLDQTLPEGTTLRAEIAQRLAGFGSYPPDFVQLKPRLEAIRDLFTTRANFNASQREAITNALAGFDPRRNIRFRSSTNVEDTERFTGAGLYDSYSGCLMDDMDGDEEGPCQCESDEENEHGVFRALRKVFASFYNDDAYLARLMHRVDETKVGMGVLVHHSFPDKQELANGVATPRFDFTVGNTNITGQMVTQPGAVSVTNPDGTSIPEVVDISGANTYSIVSLKQGSSLVPLGGYAMNWMGDYQQLISLFTRVAQGFHRLEPAQRSIALDFEYKKDALLGLVVKQVRRIPLTSATSETTAYLIDEPMTCDVAQYGSVFANHRLKTLWNLHSFNLRLHATNLTHGIYGQSSLEYLDNGTLHTVSGMMNSWPNASNSPSGSENYWTTGEGASRRDWKLETALKTTVSGGQAPVFTLADFPMTVTVTYATPVPTLYGETLTNITSEIVRLQPRNEDVSSSVFQERNLVCSNVVTIHTTYYWPKFANGMLMLFTPLQRFVETRITGLTANPIVLTNYYSQTYGAHVHNYMEEFLFEPRLEPGLPPATLAELNAANIKQIYVSAGGGRAGLFFLIGFDQSLRRLY